MKKVGIVIDNYKKSTFAKHLNNAGFEFEERRCAGDLVTTLTVTCKDADEPCLSAVIVTANRIAANERGN